ncbi:MAG: leucine-rich repeat protein [Eubacteriales bacterium]|nr:leucine-rich repeat protein [Eubacteriales bacterium]
MKIHRCMNCMSELEDERPCCPVCGYRHGSVPQPECALREYTILKGRYLVGRVMGRGGFGITYVGFDLMLNIKVAVKEYFPDGAVNRDAAHVNDVSWNSSVADQDAGCRSFIREAQKMAKIDRIPEIVRVRDVFMENETAYIVMDFVEGETLKDRLKREGPMEAKKCISLLMPIIKGMDTIHKQNMIHRDIKPDNIMIQKDGNIRLLDLGAAKELDLKKRDSGGKNNDGELPPTQRVVSNGFSPLEQYSETGHIGPWTDVYAMCATIYYCITGKVLPSSLSRMQQEELQLTEAQRKKIPEEILKALKKGLALRPEKRIQTMEELEAALKRKRKPKWLKKAAIAAGIVVLTAGGVFAAGRLSGPAPVAKGDCGENLTWSLSETGELVISGSGDMEDYSGNDENCAPWYRYRDSITEIEIGEKVTGIGDYAFWYVMNVKTLYIPEKISSLGSECLNIIDLAEIEVDAKNEYYKAEDGVLYTSDHTSLVRYPPAKSDTVYTVPDGTLTVETSAFAKCRYLEQVELPDTVGAIGWLAFYDCPGLSSIRIPDGVTTIEPYTFSYCSSLSSIEIPASVTAIGGNAFSNCSALETVTYKGEEPEIAENAFENCPLLAEEEILAEGTCGENLTWSLSETGKLTISGSGDMEDYSTNDDNRPPWYGYCDSITEIEIGKEVTGIGDFAFFNVNQVESLYVPEQVKRLGLQFAGMRKLSNITVDEKNKDYISMDGVLYTADRTSLERYPMAKEGNEYTVLDGTVEIGSSAFTECRNLEQVMLPDTVETIGRKAFSWCDALRSIEIPSGVTSIGEWAFNDCDLLETVTYKGEKPEIAENAFANCPLLAEEKILAEGTCGEKLTWSLSETGKLTISGSGDMEDYSENPPPWDEYRDSITEIKIGGEVTKIGACAFFNVNNVESLYIPEKVSSLGKQFADMIKLSNITVNEKNKHYISVDGVLYTADQTCLVRYPIAKQGTGYTVLDGTVEIGAFAFESNDNLEQVMLPDTVETIGRHAFSWCDTLRSIEIPSGVTSIGEFAFYSCDSLETVTYKGEKPEIAENAFANCPLLE